MIVLTTLIAIIWKANAVVSIARAATVWPRASGAQRALIVLRMLTVPGVAL